MRRFLISAALVALAGALVGLACERAGRANTAMAPTGASGPCIPAAGPALSFNGTTDYASTQTMANSGAVNSVSYWINATFNNSDGLAYQLGTNSTSGAYWSDPNSGTPYAGTWAVSLYGTDPGSSGTTVYARPTAGVWHHVVAVYDSSKTTSSSTSTPTVTLYFDGVLQTPQQQVAGNANNIIPASYMWIMSRNATSLLAAGSMTRFALWTSALAQADATALFGGAAPTGVAGGAAYYWKMDSTGTMSNLGSGAAASMVPSGTTLLPTGGPVVCFS